MSTSEPNSLSGYFYTPALKGLVQQLVHMAFFGEGLSVVTGGAGSGKTSLARELLLHLDQAHEVASLELDSSKELSDCIELVMQVLGISSASGLSVGESLSELRHYVQALVQDKKLAILILDNAHYLDDQAIGALVSLLQGKGDVNFGLHLLFFSEPGLDHRIDALQILDVAVYDFLAPEFSPSEMGSFLAHCSRTDVALSSAEVQKLWASAKGVPGKALSLLDGKNSDKSSPEDKTLLARFKVPLGHVAAVLVLAIVLFYSLTYRDSGDSDAQTIEQQTQENGVLKPAGDVEQKVDTQFVSDAVSALTPTMLSPKSLKPKRLDSEHLKPEPLKPELALLQEDGTAAVEGLREASNALENNVLENNALENNVLERNVLENNVDVANPVDSGVSDIASVRDNKGNSNPSLALKPHPISTTIPVRPAKPATPKPTQVPSHSIASASASAHVPGAPSLFLMTEAEQFILHQDPSTYTLQVVAASKKASLESYIARQPNKGTLKMYRSYRKDKSWFIIVQGVYSTREQASNAVASLPKDQVKGGAWPRKISSVQDEIETFRRSLQ